MFLDYLQRHAGKTAVCLTALIALASAREAWCGALKAAPSLSVDERYDTNPYRRSSREVEEINADFVTKLTPSLKAAYETMATRMNAAYSLDASFYTKRSPYSSVEHTINLGLNTDISNKTTMSLNNVFNRRKSSLYNGEILIGFDTVSTDTLAVWAEHKLNPRLNVSVGVSEGFNMYKGPDKIDSRKDGVTLSGQYDAGNNRQLGAYYGYGNTVFETPSGANTAEVHTLSANLADRLSQTLNFNIGAGTIYNADKESGRYDWTGNVGVTKTFETASAALSYIRGIANGAGITSEKTMRDTVQAAWKYDFGNDAGLEITGETTKMSSKPEHTIDTKSYNAGAALRWMAYSWLKAAVGYSRARQWGDGALETRDIEQDAVFITLTATGAEWRSSL